MHNNDKLYYRVIRLKVANKNKQAIHNCYFCKPTRKLISQKTLPFKGK